MKKTFLPLLILILATISTTTKAQTALTDADRAQIFPTMRQFLAQAGKKWQVSGYKIQYPDMGADSIRVLIKYNPDGTSKVLIKVARKGPNGWALKSIPKRDWPLYVRPQNVPESK